MQLDVSLVHLETYCAASAMHIPYRYSSWRSTDRTPSTDISTISTAHGGGANSGAGSRFSLFSIGTAGDWSIMFGVAVVGGLVGAVAVL